MKIFYSEQNRIDRPIGTKVDYFDSCLPYLRSLTPHVMETVPII